MTGIVISLYLSGGKVQSLHLRATGLGNTLLWRFILRTMIQAFYGNWLYK
jgi:hypothetical protein